MSYWESMSPEVIEVDPREQQEYDEYCDVVGELTCPSSPEAWAEAFRAAWKHYRDDALEALDRADDDCLAWLDNRDVQALLRDPALKSRELGIRIASKVGKHAPRELIPACAGDDFLPF